ncbi:MAG: hypothetical protein F6K28_59910, partial [Microcoleus sp. SIO2G3]|nr:hypothetical protein [Microcoleus sp. SIO2G3]
MQVNFPNQQTKPESISSAAPSLNSEQVEQLMEKLAEAAEQSENELAREYQLCSDRSEAYLKLPLREVDPVFKLCATELL